MNTPVSFEIAKLLKEKGFDIPVAHNYGKKGELGHIIDLALDLEMVHNKRADNFNQYVGTYRQVSAPTISEVVMWLYEKHGIWIASKKVNGLNKWFAQIYKNNSNDLCDTDIVTISPAEAYTAAIEYTLTKLIK